MDKDTKTSLGQYCEVSYCMGVVDCYSAKTICGKIFWVIVITVGCLLTIFETWFCFDSFINQSPYSISISMKASENGIPFPDITICNFNRAKQSIINQTLVDLKVLQYAFQLLPASYDLSLSAFPPERLPLYQKAWDNYFDKNEDDYLKNLFRKFGHGAKESIVIATYANGLIIGNDSADEIFTSYGRCFRMKVAYNQSIPGPFAGVKLLLDPQLDEYMKDVLINNYFQQGFAISLGYIDEPQMTNALMLTPGVAVNIALKASQNTVRGNMFPMHDKPCRQDASLKLLNIPYSPQNCILDCFYQATWNRCGCIFLAEVKKNLNLTLCNISTAVDCAMGQRPNTGLSLPVKQITSDSLVCTKNCRNPCQDFSTVEATMSMTNLKINNQAAAISIFQELLKTKYNRNQLQQMTENAIIAKIFFSTSDITVIETGETTEFLDFIGNVGGQLGLWLGISIVSILQLLFYFVLGFINGEYFSKKKASTKVEAIK